MALGTLLLPRVRGRSRSGETGDPVVSRFSKPLPLARRRAGPARRDRRGEGSLAEGHGYRTGLVSEQCSGARAVDPARKTIRTCSRACARRAGIRTVGPPVNELVSPAGGIMQIIGGFWVYAGILEYLQHFSPGRHPSVADFVASALGALCSALAVTLVWRRLSVLRRGAHSRFHLTPK